METRTVKTVRIFLASGAELSKDRVEFGNFMNKLRIHYMNRGFDLVPIEWEYLENDDHTHRKQDEYNEQIKKCHIFVSLFHTTAGKYTIEEFRTALKENKKRNIPMLTFMRELAYGEKAKKSLKDFKKKYFDKYFWGTYGNNDKLHLDFALWLDKYLLSNSTFTVKDGVITLGDVPVADISQQPFAANNQEYLSLVGQLQNLENDIEQQRDNMAKYPDDFTFPETLSKKLLEKARCQEELVRHQEALLGAAKRIVEIEKQQVGKKLQNAIEAFNNGQLERANTLLDQITLEGASHIERLEQDKERLKQDKDLVHQDIEALQLQTQTVMAKVETPIEERIAHVAEIYAKADDWANRSAYSKKKYARLLFDYASFLDNYARYEDAEMIYLRQIAYSTELYGIDSTDTVMSYINLGTVYYHQGKYNKALDIYHLAFQILEKEFGIDHPYTAKLYSNIGKVFFSLEDYDKALSYFLKALVIQEHALGTTHPDTATSYNFIGGIYYKREDFSNALEYHLKALAIREKILGTEHTDTAKSLTHIGSDYYSLGDYDRALRFHFKALAIKEKVLGIDNPSTGTSYRSIGLVYYSQGNYCQALEFFCKDLAINKKMLGEFHVNTFISYESIGMVYDSKGDYNKALKYYFKALEIRKNILGIEHPSTATSYNNIGMVYYSQGNYHMALEYLNMALNIFEKTLGLDHPNNVKVRNNISLIEKQSKSKRK